MTRISTPLSPKHADALRQSEELVRFRPALADGYSDKEYAVLRVATDDRGRAYLLVFYPEFQGGAVATEEDIGAVRAAYARAADEIATLRRR